MNNSLWAVMPVRNEDWIIGLSARAALTWCDGLVVLAHACTDNTVRILIDVAEEHPDRVAVILDDENVWTEMRHRQMLLEEARKRGATHIALVDADEVLTGNVREETREQILKLLPGQLLATRMFSVWRAPNQYRVDRCSWSNRKDFSLAFGDAPNLCWQTRDGYDHHHRPPFGLATNKAPVTWTPEGGVMHLQWVCWRRLVAKHALYKVTERVRWPNKNVSIIDHIYNDALDECGIKYTAVPQEWWQPYEPWMEHLNLNHEPWQEAACKELVAKHGAEYFAGLNLFGVV